MQAARTFSPDTDRWAVCGASTVFSDRLLNLRSVDGGKHWTVSDTGLAITPQHAGDHVIVTLHDFQLATIRLVSLVISRDDNYRTSDGGTTWTRTTAQPSPIPPRVGAHAVANGAISGSVYSGGVVRLLVTEGDILVRRAGGSVTRTAHISAAGTYNVTLPPSRYELKLKVVAGAVDCVWRPVTVQAGHPTHHDLHPDKCGD